jgi:hypothetical protein
LHRTVIVANQESDFVSIIVSIIIDVIIRIIVGKRIIAAIVIISAAETPHMARQSTMDNQIQSRQDYSLKAPETTLSNSFAEKGFCKVAKAPICFANSR